MEKLNIKNFNIKNLIDFLNFLDLKKSVILTALLYHDCDIWASIDTSYIWWRNIQEKKIDEIF